MGEKAERVSSAGKKRLLMTIAFIVSFAQIADLF
jgi:hypothetical protein